MPVDVNGFFFSFSFSRFCNETGLMKNVVLSCVAMHGDGWQVASLYLWSCMLEVCSAILIQFIMFASWKRIEDLGVIEVHGFSKFL